MMESSKYLTILESEDFPSENSPDTSFEVSEYGEDMHDQEFVLLLISMYRDCPELWDRKSKAYTNKYKRKIALNKITESLRRLEPSFSAEKLKRKINTLRSNFNREHRKLKTSIASGVPEDEVYQPKLWYYYEMLFVVDDVPTLDKSEETLSIRSLPAIPTIRRIIKKPKPNHERYSQVQKAHSENEVLARSWALKVMKLEPDQRRFAEKIIYDVLFEGEMGSLTRHGVIFPKSDSSSSN